MARLVGQPAMANLGSAVVDVAKTSANRGRRVLICYFKQETECQML